MHKITKSLISCFLSISVIFSFFYFAAGMNAYADTSGATVTISGTFYLPNGAKAGVGGMDVAISAESLNQYLSTNINIPEGANSQSYSIAVPKNAISSVWALHYNINGANEDYLSTGYYGGAKPVTDRDKSALIDIDTDTDLSSINMYAIPAKYISGQINLPSGETASGDISVRVAAVSSEYTSKAYITIFKGQTSASYNLAVPADYCGLNWKVDYYTYNNKSDKNYVTIGYYSTDGTKTESEDAFTFAGISENKTNIDMGLISNGTNSETSNVITLSIDNSDQAVSNLSDDDIKIIKKEDNIIYYTDVRYGIDMSIVKGQNEYTIKIKNLDWFLNDTYYAWIKYGDKILRIDLNKSMQGQTVKVSQDVIPVKIDIPFAQTNFKIHSISLYTIIQGVGMNSINFDNVGSTIYIPAGTYRSQIYASDNVNNYILTKPSITLDSTNNTVSFGQNELTKLNFTINDPDNYKWQLGYIAPEYFNSSIRQNVSVDKPLYVSSIKYTNFNIGLYSRKGWEYAISSSDADFSTTSEKSITLDNNFSAKFTFKNISYPPGITPYFGDCNLDVKDGNNNRLAYIRDRILCGGPKVNIKFYNDQATYEQNADNNFFPDYIRFTIPSIPGFYNVSVDVSDYENHKLDSTISAQSQINITSSAKIPSNTVIIAENAYNVRCLFKPEFSSEITDYLNNAYFIYFKIDGINETTWTWLHDPFITAGDARLPAVTYNDGNGNITKYAQGDGGIMP